MTIDRVTSADGVELRAFLTEADLTVAGLDGLSVHLWVERDDTGSITGCAGYEASSDGDHALVRSVAVAPDQRGSGAGSRLAMHALRTAAASGVSRAWLFSRRSGPFWQKLGFHPAERDELAAVLAETHQVQLFTRTGQLTHEVAWSRSLDDLSP
ncbi:MAG: GNAT family N-acetyltransferase [Pseudolysinimonas sp.]